MTATHPPVVVDSSVPPARMAHAFSVQLTCRAAGMLASVVSVAMTARYLGPDLYGQLATAVLFVGMWASLADLGINTVIVRRVTAGRGDLEHLVRVNSGLSLVYCVPLAALAAGSGLLIYHGSSVRIMLVVLSASLLMTTMTARFEPVFLATVRFSAVAVADVVSRVATLGMIGWLVAQRADVMWFAVAQLIPPAVQLLIQGSAAARRISLRPIFSRAETMDLLRESLAPMGVVVVAILYWRADGVILSLLSSQPEVGVYLLAYTVAGNTAIVSTFFLKSTLSTATELFARDVDAFAGFLRRSVELMCFVAVPIAVVGAMLAGPLIGVFGDQAYLGRGTPALALLFVAVAVRFVNGALGQGLFACHQQRFQFRIALFGLIVNVALNVMLDGRFGAVGAGISLVCTEMAGTVITSWWLCRHCGYHTPVAFLLRLLVPLAAAAAITQLLVGVHVVLAVGSAVAAYLGTSLLVGPIRWSTLASMRGKQVQQ